MGQAEPETVSEDLPKMQLALLEQRKRKAKQPLVEILCAHCGRTFKVQAYRALTAKCCSRLCAQKYYTRRPFHGPKRPVNRLPNKGCPTVTCRHCSKVFRVFPARALAAKYCSRHCAGHSYKRKARPPSRAVLPPTACEYCGALFKTRRQPHATGWQRFCSRRCRQLGQWCENECPTCHTRFRVHFSSKNQKRFCCIACIPRGPCKLCGRTIHGVVGKSYCSMSCAAIANQTLKSKQKYITIGYAACLRRTGKIACERCAIDNPRVLQVHHRDRNRKHTKPSNLEVLCANCHLLEHEHRRYSGKKREEYVRVAEFIAALPAFYPEVPRAA